MALLVLALLIAALVLFILGTIPIPSKINLVALGLACVTLAAILSGHLPLL